MKARSKMHLLYYCSLKVMLLTGSMNVFVTVPWLMSGILSVNLTAMDIQEICLQASSKKVSFSFLSINNWTPLFFFNINNIQFHNIIIKIDGLNVANPEWNID